MGHSNINKSIERPELTDEFVKKHINLVKGMAYHYYRIFNFQIELEELISYAYLGLVNAINKYNSDKNSSFETYASIRIMGSIIDNVRNNNFISRTIFLKSIELTRLQNQYYEINNKEITDAELASKLKMPISKVKEIKKYKEINKLVSLNNLSVEYSCNDTDRKFELIELKAILDKLFDDLNDKEKMSIYYYYYLQLNDREISEYMNVSKVRAGQIRNSALSKLGTYRNKQLLKDYKYI